MEFFGYEVAAPLRKIWQQVGQKFLGHDKVSQSNDLNSFLCLTLGGASRNVNKKTMHPPLNKEKIMKKLSKRIVPFVLSSVLSLPALAQDTVLRVSSWLPPSHPIVRDMVLPWSEDVAAATEGRVTIQLLDAPLGPPPAHMDLAMAGAADITYGAHDYTPGRFTLHQIVQLPFLADSAATASVAYWRLFEEHLASAGEHKGVQVLSVFTHGPGLMYLRDKAPSPLSELAGAKIRVAGPMTSDMSKALGLTPVQAPAPSSYEILSGGIVDGTYFPAESIPFFRITDELTHGLRAPGGLYNISFFMVMNSAAFQRLSEADQKAIMKLSGEAFALRAGQAWDAADQRGYEAMDGKVDIMDASEADIAALTAATAPMFDKVRESYDAKGIDFEAAMTSLKADIEALSAQ
ncbi:TRAP transporter substrate-binding protein [Hoeflea poritis]|uniref:TRAP transporter substrate-binding protein n=1 Tax=Hoeflea poritis TaxID=2993659 RepID=A0ABT4VX03_9HYPH|nr:TRAP transporter substrate-binding protein [Hoeflea poritis]MDA4848572.1 TRAP transporter substrate-binding protein [Hoeflea poritis]